MSIRKTIHGHRRITRSCPLQAIDASPLKQKWLDRVQTGLSFAGLGLPMADALNAAISTGRAVHAKVMDKRGHPGYSEKAKQHTKAALINTAAILPGVGEAIKSGKGLKSLAQTTNVLKQGKDVVKAGKNIYQLGKAGKGAVPAAVGATQTGMNYGYWKGTGEQIKSEFDK